jgi:hypothetical protein
LAWNAPEQNSCAKLKENHKSFKNRRGSHASIQVKTGKKSHATVPLCIQNQSNINVLDQNQRQQGIVHKYTSTFQNISLIKLKYFLTQLCRE